MMVLVTVGDRLERVADLGHQLRLLEEHRQEAMQQAAAPFDIEIAALREELESLLYGKSQTSPETKTAQIQAHSLQVSPQAQRASQVRATRAMLRAKLLDLLEQHPEGLSTGEIVSVILPTEPEGSRDWIDWTLRNLSVKGTIERFGEKLHYRWRLRRNSESK